ncbi:MAG: hypothetical protein R3E10_15850 [Gemmatimonadota bacterium]
MLIVFAVLLSFALAGGLIWGAVAAWGRHERRRDDDVEAVARSLGLTPDPAAKRAEARTLLASDLFGFGSGGEVTRLFRGSSDGFDVLLFDLNVSVAGEVSMLSGLRLRWSGFGVPTFRLRREGLLDRLSGGDIDFHSHLSFSKRYLLQGEDETAIRGTFHPRLLEQLELEEVEAEAVAGALLFRTARAKPADLTGFVQRALRIASLIRSQET